MQTILLTVKSNYGTRVVYPACPTSTAFAEIAGSRTLTLPVLRIMKHSLGIACLANGTPEDLAWLTAQLKRPGD